MSYEAWGEPDGRPYPQPSKRVRVRVDEGDFRAFEEPTACAPERPHEQCVRCERHRPALNKVVDRKAVLIDATTVMTDGKRCPMFDPIPDDSRSV